MIIIVISKIKIYEGKWMNWTNELNWAEQGAKVWNDISDDIKLLPLKIFNKNLS